MDRSNMKMSPGELRYFRAYLAYLAQHRGWKPQGAMYGVDRYRARRIRRWTEQLAQDLIDNAAEER
jgi:hypothetical protein